MDYCMKGQWVTETGGLGRTGLVDRVVARRMPNKDGSAVVQFGSGGPFDTCQFSSLREATGAEIAKKTGER